MPPSPTVVLRLAASDAAGAALAARLASGYLETARATGIAALPGAGGAVQVVGLQDGRWDAIAIASTTPGAALAALAAGTADGLMSSRRLSVPVGRTAPMEEHVLAVQGAVVVVHPSNPVSAVSVQQLRAVLAGQATDWSELGGPPGAVHVYVMDEADPLHDLVTRHGDLTPAARRVRTGHAVRGAVAADPGGIGVTAADASSVAKVLAVSDAGAAPVMPDSLSVATERYPLTRRLYLYTVASANEFAWRFLDYVHSPASQAVVAETAMAPLAVRAEATTLLPNASARFRQLVAGATRLSLDFRFEDDSMALDSRARHDVARVAAYVRDQRITPSRIILAGFAGDSAIGAADRAASQLAAETVAEALGRAGVKPGRVAAFGGELPVADNAALQGSQRNQRVEIYLAP